MTVKGHVLSSAPIAYAISQVVPGLGTEQALILYAFGVLIGTILPDIDEPESYIGRRFYGLAFLIKKVNRHRGITHSIWAILLPLVLAIGTGSHFLFGLTVGVMTHIMGDMLTNSGVKGFLSPFYEGRITLLPLEYRFQTGGTVEYIIIFILLLVDGYLLLSASVL